MASNKKKSSTLTQMSMHSVKNMMGTVEERSLFSEKFSSSDHENSLFDGIDRFGFDLTDFQFRVLEGILRGFSETNYKGNLSPIEKEDLLDKRPSNSEFAYKYIDEIPRLRATQKELLEWSGLSRGSVAHKERLIEALSHLAKTPYCYYYERLAYGEDGNPRKKSNGRWQKEEVMAIDTLFSIKAVKGKGSSRISYYEFIPSSIFLDQRENYFILIPNNWREEVLRSSGKKRVSSYTYRFLLSLRYQYELRRRSQSAPKPYRIQRSPEEVANSLRMSGAMIKRKKKQVNALLEEGYAVAKKLGYLLDYERSGYIDTLTLNDEKYRISCGEEERTLPQLESSSSGEDVANNKFSEETEELFAFFHDKIKQTDSAHLYPRAGAKTKQLREFDAILKQRPIHQIKELLDWSYSRKYWISRFSTPSKLKKNFQEGILEMSAESKSSPKARGEINRILSQKLKDTYQCSEPMQVELLNSSLEVSNLRGAHFSLSYEDKDFRLKLERELKKWSIQAALD